jgi:hypothetical protein
MEASTKTVTDSYHVPAGTTEWVADKCKNDRDGSVDCDGRVRITGVSSGRYDIQFTDKTGRNCVVKGIEVKPGAVFSIDNEMSHCSGE